MLVEKVDLKSLFSPVCAEFYVPIANAGGWPDIGVRAEIMGRFSYWEQRGKRPVLLYCGDHDPGGLAIGESYHKLFADLGRAVGWWPDNLIIERFGLNFDFIERHRLSWINNLATSHGKFPLNDPRHADHGKPYVQTYLEKFGARKVEANALVVRPEAGRDVCRSAILQDVSTRAARAYERDLQKVRESVRLEISRLMRKRR